MYFTSIVTVVLLLTSVYIPQVEAAEPPLPVIVSIAPQKWIVEQIADPSNVDVTVLVGQGSDPHSYEPMPSQMKKVAEAKVYFTIGLPFETVWAPRIANAASGLSLCSMIEGLNLQKREESEEEHDEHQNLSAHTQKHSNDTDDAKVVERTKGYHHSHEEFDPHTWLSPRLVVKMIPHVVKELTRQRPEKAELFTQNAQSLQQELERLDSSIKKQISPIPQENRVFLTFHPAWHYFAKEYGFKELTIEVDGKEPSPKSMKNIIDLAKKYALTTIFSEPQFSRAPADTIAEQIHAKVFIVDPLGENIVETWEYMLDILIPSLKNTNNEIHFPSSSSCH